MIFRNRGLAALSISNMNFQNRVPEFIVEKQQDPHLNLKRETTRKKIKVTGF